MFAAYSKPAQAYANVGVETGVVAANPHKLILMLFDGALMACASAKQHIEQRDIAKKGQAISKAIDIVTNGLKASLDMNVGGELAERLGALYDYMAARLIDANVNDNGAAVEEVHGLLLEIRGAWEEIASDPAALSANKVAA